MLNYIKWCNLKEEKSPSAGDNRPRTETQTLVQVVPERIYNPFREFWFCPGVSCQWDPDQRNHLSRLVDAEEEQRLLDEGAPRL